MDTSEFQGALAAFLVLAIPTAIALGFIYAKRRAVIKRLGPDHVCVRQWVEYDYQGAIFNLTYTGKNASLKVLSVAGDIDWGGTVRLRNERGLDRVAKEWRVATELQLGDREFDSACYILSENEEDARRYLRDAAKRRSIVSLIKLGITEISISRRRIAVEMRWAPLPMDFPVGLVEEILGLVYVLTQDLPEERGGEVSGYSADVSGISRDKSRDLSRETTLPMFKREQGNSAKLRPIEKGTFETIPAQFATWIFLFGIFSFSPVLLVLPLPIDHAPFLESVILTAILLFILMAILSYNHLKGQTNAHHKIIFVLIFSLVGVPLSTLSGAVIANVFLMQGQGERYYVDVLHVSTRGEEKLTDWQITVPSWQKERETITFSRPFWLEKERLKIGSKVTVTVKEGGLGFPWVADYHQSRKAAKMP